MVVLKEYEIFILGLLIALSLYEVNASNIIKRIGISG